MNHNYIRPGGVAADLPDGWRDDVDDLCDAIPPRLDEYDELLTGQPIFRDRTEGIGVITPERGHRPLAPPVRSCARPVCRGTCGATMPYLYYDQVDFDVVVGTYGDAFDRYAIRLNEMRESIKIVRQILDLHARGRLPRAGQEGDPAAARPHRRVDGSADPPLQALHRGLQGPRGRGLRRRRVTARRARLLPRVRRSAKPYRLHIRGPVVRQPPDAAHDDAGRLGRRCRRRHLARSTRSWARWTGDGHGSSGEMRAARRGDDRALPALALGAASRCCTWRRSRTAGSRGDAMEHIAELLGLEPAEVLGTASFYDMFFTAAGRQVPRFGVHQHRLHAQRRLRAARARRAEPRRAGRATPPPTAGSPSRRSSASPAATKPVPRSQLALLRLTSPTRLRQVRRRPPRRARSTTRCRRHGTLNRVQRTATVCFVTVSRRTQTDRHAAAVHRAHDRRATRSSATSPPAATKALRKALTMTPEEVHDEVKTSGILGRGGAGFPAGIKWKTTMALPQPHYLVVNGDESEPATFKDHMLIERDPHQLIEGIAHRRVRHPGVQAFLYVRGEFALGQERMQAALNEAYAHGAVGRNIFGSEFSHRRALVHPGAGAYICGEETALLESLEGKRGFPRIKVPPKILPATIGVYGKPTVVNNVETLSNMPVDREQRRRRVRRAGRGPLDRHADLLAVRPREAARQLRGRDGEDHLPRPHLRPVYGGGIRGGRSSRRSFPAARRRRGSARSTSTACSARTRSRRPTASCPAAAARCSARGSIVAMDDTTCPVRAAWRLARFFAKESCGQCTPCREGTGWLDRIMCRIEHGDGRTEDLDLLLDVSDNIAPGLAFPYPMTTICFLGPSRGDADRLRHPDVPRRVRSPTSTRAVPMGSSGPGATTMTDTPQSAEEPVAAKRAEVRDRSPSTGARSRPTRARSSSPPPNAPASTSRASATTRG